MTNIEALHDGSEIGVALDSEVGDTTKSYAEKIFLQLKAKQRRYSENYGEM